MLRGIVAGVLYDKAVTLGTLDRSVDEIAVYDELVARFGTADDLPLREQVAKALFNKGARLGALGRSEDAVAVYDDVLARFGTADDLPLREQVAKALFNKGFTLGRSEDAIAVYDELVTRFSTADDLPLREPVANALFHKGFTLGTLGRNEDAIAVYDELVARFGTADDLPLREHVAKALVNKGVTLGKLGQFSQAVTALREADEFNWDGKSRQILTKLIEDILNQEQELLLRDPYYTDISVGNTLSVGAGREWHDFSRITELPPAEIAEKNLRLCPILGTKQEILQLTDEQLAQALAHRSRLAVNDAKTIIDATLTNAPVMVEAGEKLLKRKPKLSKEDFSEAELNDPTSISQANDFVNQHRRTRIEDLDDETANRLRRSRWIVKYDADRRAKASATPS